MTDMTALATLSLDLPDEIATQTLAHQLAPLAIDRPRDAPADAPPGPAAGGRIHLRGDLGAGKTTLVRALLRAAGITGRIKSPSYALLESYKISNLYFYHLDFYRFSDPREWLDAGLRDIVRHDALVLIEWPERAQGLLPPPDLDVELVYAGEGRRAQLTAFSARGQAWLTALNTPDAASPSPRKPPPGGA
ncbi:TsaE protein, required for threonylcarbamoyladenosine t(6)A37 formation in tRNA [Orrella dioscoreae]|uniref:tRNA threonylcarbamoyladenosine biosynthesis protein TsaE n=3 Tax=root TaxID=1 RepID=A0A1C3K0Q2_9BURK|nr:TsaE protein, required for threonylcarbamoyladenosine t(6)A37 formation in tRNA [Orrella dioscoreae]SOE51156.1 TsaE protein, required for threonylcarbamoyladenosine t(6)A37 formation in tRNA [Orrella dioscoreae]